MATGFQPLYLVFSEIAPSTSELSYGTMGRELFRGLHGTDARLNPVGCDLYSLPSDIHGVACSLPWEASCCLDMDI